MTKKVLLTLLIILSLAINVNAQKTFENVYSEQNFLTKILLTFQGLTPFVVTPSISGNYIDVRTPREPDGIKSGEPILVTNPDKEFKCSFDACVIYFYDAKTYQLYNCPMCKTDILGTGGIGLSKGVYVGKKLVRGQFLNKIYVPRTPYRYVLLGDNEKVEQSGETVVIKESTAPTRKQFIEKSGIDAVVNVGCGVGSVLDLTTNTCVGVDDTDAKIRLCNEEGSVYDFKKNACVNCDSGKLIENNICVVQTCDVGERLINNQCVPDHKEVWVGFIPFVLIIISVVFSLAIILIWGSD